MKKALAIITMSLLLAGCGLFASPRERAEARTPEYRQGYDDGCAAAGATGVNPREKPFRDEAMYKSNHAYHAGWSSGFSSCRNMNNNSTPGSPLDDRIFNPNPGH